LKRLAGIAVATRPAFELILEKRTSTCFHPNVPSGDSKPQARNLGIRLLLIGVVVVVSCFGCRQRDSLESHLSHLSNEDLINSLASPSPPLHTNRDWTVDDNSELLKQWNLHTNLEPAKGEIYRRGKGAWKDLARNFDDDRYCNSANDDVWINWSVGDECFALIADEVESYREFLKLGKLTPQYFYSAIQKSDVTNWMTANEAKSLPELQLEAADWAFKEGQRVVAEHHMRPEALDALIEHRKQLAARLKSNH
jgi:hypothetical protein